MEKTSTTRSERRRNVLLLEKSLSFRARLFCRLALRRGLHRLRYAVLILMAVAAVGACIWYTTEYAVSKATGLSIDKIAYESRQRLISKEQALELLGIKGSVNLATLDASALEQKLLQNLCISSATVRIAPPDTLQIELDERVPIVYVEMESAADQGQRTKLFMGPDGILFPVVPEYHRNFLNVPIWYLHPTDVKPLKDKQSNVQGSEMEPGREIEEHKREPILNLIAASNHYDIAEIPAIREIFRPKEWKIVISLEDGTEVLMQVYNLNEQMDRLANILEHVRTTHRHAASINVAPRLNPIVVYRKEAQVEEKPEARDEKPAKKPRARGRERRPRRNNNR